jgi:hypothetical protein
MKEDVKYRIDRRIVSPEFPWGFISLLLVFGEMVDHAFLWSIITIVITLILVGAVSIASKLKMVDVDEYLLRKLKFKDESEKKAFEEILKRNQDEKGTD